MIQNLSFSNILHSIMSSRSVCVVTSGYIGVKEAETILTGPEEYVDGDEAKQ